MAFFKENFSLYIYMSVWMFICEHWFHALFIGQSCGKKRKILKKSKKIKNIEKNTVKRMFTLELRITLCVCVCVCVCVDYICILLCVVVYVIVRICVYYNTYAAWQIQGCHMNICVAMCSVFSGSREIWPNDFFFYYVQWWF